ncbi:MAG: OprO/OprP family phosphate-selective porin [Candidatus Nitrospinota bacterium M3_3B_026]
MEGIAKMMRIMLTVSLMFCSLSHIAYAKEPLEAEWKTGLRFTSADKAFQIKVGGRLMNDWAWLSADDELKSEETVWESGTEFRRARLYVGGHIHENVKFKVQYDFAGGDADFKDAYIALTKISGIGQLKVGRFKQPFGLEELTSSKYITFMERAMAIEAFAPSRQSGLLIGSSAWDKRLTWALSTYRITDGYGEDYGDNDMNYAARITVLPWKSGDNLVHLGAAYTAIKPNGDTVRFRSRPEIHLAPMRLADTHSINSDSVGLLGVEAAAVFGPASLQGEFISANVSNLDGEDASLSGYYVFGSFFLTGESRPYKKGAFGRVKPNSNFGSGAGALEAALRFSSVDLEDGGIEGHEVTTVTAGVNWYLNPNTRVMLNYVSADQADVGTATGFMTRFQVDF